MATDWTLTCESCATVRTFRDAGHAALRDGQEPVDLPFPDAREAAATLRAQGWDGRVGVYEHHVCLGCGEVVRRLSTPPPPVWPSVVVGIVLGIGAVAGLARLGLPPHLGGLGVGMMVAFVPPMLWMPWSERYRRWLTPAPTCPRCGGEDLVWMKWVVGRLPCPGCGARAVVLKRKKVVSLG